MRFLPAMQLKFGPALAAVVALCALTTGAAQAEQRVVATIKPVHALVSQVMLGVGTPQLLVKGAASPHSYAMKPSDAKALNSAKVFFRVSPVIEPFTDKIVSSLPKSVRVVTLAEYDGVRLLDRRSGDTFEAHQEHGKDHDHDAGHDHEDAHQDGAARDGHIWLDPDNAKAMVESIVRVLGEVYPDDIEKLKANAVRTIADIDALKAEIAGDLAGVKGKPFVVFHDAYQYFERRFGLEALGSITVSPEVQPSAKRLSEIRAKIVALNAQCVFAEPNFSPGLVANVIEGTNARSATLDPEGTTASEGPNAYFDIMRALAAGLKSCLSPGT